MRNVLLLAVIAYFWRDVLAMLDAECGVGAYRYTLDGNV